MIKTLGTGLQNYERKRIILFQILPTVRSSQLVFTVSPSLPAPVLSSVSGWLSSCISPLSPPSLFHLYIEFPHSFYFISRPMYLSPPPTFYLSPLMHSFIQCLLNAWVVLSTVLADKDTVMKGTVPAL